MPDSVSDWRDIYGFWFPEAIAEAGQDAIAKRVAWWSGGTSAQEMARFLPTLEAARGGGLDHWCDSPAGRLSLIIVLDQFPRALYEGSSAAYASDGQALALAEEGLRSGDYDRLRTIFEQVFFLLPLVHTEGPGHLLRLAVVERAATRMLGDAPSHLRHIAEFSRQQARGNIDVISRFGRFPHRNGVLGRASTDDELVYIEKGDFVHRRRPASSS